MSILCVKDIIVKLDSFSAQPTGGRIVNLVRLKKRKRKRQLLCERQVDWKLACELPHFPVSSPVQPSQPSSVHQSSLRIKARGFKGTGGPRPFSGGASPSL